MGAVIGIDFGTTNSLCAWLDGERPTVIPNARGSRATPSVVALTAKGEVLVGESAKNQALVNPERTIAGVKRLLGGDGRLGLGEGAWRPVEIASWIIASLRRDAELFLGTEVRKAVIAAPAHFSDKERRALSEAGRLAGLEIIRIVNEPTAAAVARAWSSLFSGERAPGLRESGEAAARRQLLLVYDFGGGTFDVTVLLQEGRDCRVLASKGDGRLGGMDIDRELRRLAAAAFKEGYGLEVSGDRILEQELAAASERAKIELSERDEAAIGLPFSIRGNAELVHPVYEIDRRAFEAIAMPFVLRSLDLAEGALSDAGVAASEIDALVLSGGSSRIPLVRRLLEERFALRPEGGVNPEEIVALGAAAWSSLESGAGRLRVRDVVSRTYGLEIEGGLFLALIEKNSPVPARESRTFTTVEDRQESVEIHVLQGESRKAAEDLSLGRFLLTGIESGSRGGPRIRVDFEIDESDMLHVSAVDIATGAEQAISIADIDRGASSETAEDLARKVGLLADRIALLRKDLVLERGLEAELDEVTARARAALPALRGGQGDSSTDGRVRLLKAELEGLVGELLARKADDPRRPALAAVKP